MLAAIAAGALSLLRRPKAQPAAQQKSAQVVLKGKEISLSGTIYTAKFIDVETQLAGSIDEFYVGVGEEVFEGQLLAKIRNAGLETARESAQTAVEAAQTRVNTVESSIIAARLEASRTRADASRARNEFDRVEKVYLRQQMLHREGATARLTFEKAQRDFEMTQAELKSLDEMARQAEEKAAGLFRDLEVAKKLLEERNMELDEAASDLSAAEIHSPADGIVIERKGEPGQELTAENRQLLRIGVDLSTLTIVLEPEPPVLKYLQVGQPALIYSADHAIDGIPGVVKEIIDSRVWVEFTRPGPDVKPGQTAQVRLKLE